MKNTGSDNSMNAWHNVRGASVEELREGERKALEEYGDIIDLPHHVSKRHPKLSMEMRAAQFAPFAALTGFGDAIGETARRTQGKPELGEDRKAELDERLAGLMRNPGGQVRLTWFEKDERKEGGSIRTEKVTVRRVDPVEKVLLLRDGSSIDLRDVLDIE